MSPDTTTEPDVDVVIDGFIAQRSFKFLGKPFRPGDPITLDVYRHPRFESLVSTGYVREVRS